MPEREVTIANRRGLHARAAAKLVSLADRFDCQVYVARGQHRVSGTSITGVMLLAAANGCKLRLSAHGREAVPALDALQALIERRFDESV